ncbi:hypothetical protein J2Z83_001061 [Virgibacillus natechei]|uniref:IDEAL domain-containing protein n=1 Tax=Virgibacillus natechei TaxID=1216297 RepID=A0ABS4IDD6_9BACI|nr:IDEAL domain-containing protein [Virgibacillus natechei]MBP1968958.1 hypothetical protein [Virgibacillus natechei]UZD14238.1 IDEAL domain-containing protein [Virgibacillus natechei]
MKQEKLMYRFYRYEGKTLQAKRKIPFEIELTARLLLDELCFNWNKNKLESEINDSIETRNEDEFIKLSELFKQYVWE